MSESVLYNEHDGVVTLTLNRPHRLNAINSDLLGELTERIRAIDDSARVVILKGEGRAFSSGHDLKDADQADAESRTREQAQQGAESMQEVTRALRKCPAPVMAAVHGYAIGGGAEIAFSCDLVIAARDTVFQFTETAVALTITNGSSYLLPAVAGLFKAKELVMVGERFSAEEAQAYGLVNRVVELDVLAAEVDRVSGLLRERAPLALRCVKRLLNGGMDMAIERALDAEVEGAVELEMTEDAREAARAFVEGRAPIFAGR